MPHKIIVPMWISYRVNVFPGFYVTHLKATLCFSLFDKERDFSKMSDCSLVYIKKHFNVWWGKDCLVSRWFNSYLLFCFHYETWFFQFFIEKLPIIKTDAKPPVAAKRKIPYTLFVCKYGKKNFLRKRKPHFKNITKRSILQE